MITIYHNSRCRKSREGLALLEQHGQPFKVVNYLQNPLSKEELEDIISKLKISPIDLVRTNEVIWKENYRGKSLSDEQIIAAMLKSPKLIERPIVVHHNSAVIGRPADKILNIL